jgi:serine/threonine-protein kinase
MVLGGRYRLDDRIAGGGMGDVWRGTDEVLGRTVAVKILLPSLLDEAGFAERFRGEARTMATVNHAGVVDIYDYGSDQNVGAYLIMEYVEGDPLSRTLSRVGRLTPARTMALVAQAADALQAAHDKGIVHRDVKPGNLLVRPNGTLVLTDFGIARSAQTGQLTAVGSVLGTASYISPEQAAGSVASPLSDVYALGVVAYQCLSGRRPFEGENPLEIAMRHVREQPAPLPPDTPPQVRAIVERAMAKDPAARFPTAAVMGQVARQAAAGLGGGPTTGIGPAGVPISVPPVPSQTSPGPIGPVSGGTRVMPAYPTSSVSPTSGARPVSGGQPVGAASPGGYNRGAASVPQPTPRRQDTGYFTGPTPAATKAPDDDGRRRLILLGILAALVTVLVIGGIGAWLVLRDNNPNGTPGGTGGSSQTGGGQQGGGPSAGTQQVNVDCGALVNQDADDVEGNLKGQGFHVTRQTQSGGRRNRVTSVSPCGAQPEGTTITLTVSTGSGGNNGPGGGGNASPSCKTGIGGGIGGCGNSQPPPGSSPSQPDGENSPG